MQSMLAYGWMLQSSLKAMRGTVTFWKIERPYGLKVSNLGFLGGFIADLTYVYSPDT